MYAVVALFLVLGTPLRIDYPGVSVTVLLLLAALAAVRVWFARGFETRYDQMGERATRQFTILLLAQSSIFSVSSAAIVLRYETAPHSILAVLFCAAAAAAGTSSLASRPAIHQSFVVAVMGPMALVLVPGLGQPGVVLLLGTVVLSAFYLREGRLASQAYRGLVMAQLDLIDAAQQIKTLHGIVPICAHCKNIRDDTGFWENVASYVQKRTEAEFSHSICPECAAKYYPELSEG